VVKAFLDAPMLVLLVSGIGLVLLCWALYCHSGPVPEHNVAAAACGLVLLSVAFVLVALRLIVYFRDGYRATTFGVPDLVDLIQVIDTKLGPELRNKVKLSFIGHSMGAYVVTGAVRILSDVFSPLPSAAPVQASSDPMQREVPSEPRCTTHDNGRIGKAFSLERLVLVSPDIPAESLVTSRASYLAESLRRFRETFLFSSKDDVVLRLLSRVANSFSVPTKRRSFGYRLGNVDMPEVAFGITKGVDSSKLRIGPMTFNEIHEALHRSDKARSASQDHPLHRISYFDCTSCVDFACGAEFCNPKPALTLAGPFNNLGIFTQLMLLFSYLRGQGPDVHAGYFQSDFLRKLIYRINCLGGHDTVMAYGGFDKLHASCIRHRIKAQWVPPPVVGPSR
jgi:pimeloyl-ACP methyl ester carboxylesterase